METRLALFYYSYGKGHGKETVENTYVLFLYLTAPLL